jgi:hypothetical protein
VKGALTRKLGPFPAFVWLGLFAVVVLGWRYLHPSPPAAADANASTLPGDLGAGAFGTGAGGGGGGALAPGDVPPADLGNGGAPVIYDPVGDSYGQDPGLTDTVPMNLTPPWYATAAGRLAAVNAVSDSGLLAHQGPGIDPGVPTPGTVKPTKKAAKRVHPKATKPGRPRSAKGRQTPRNAHAAAPAHAKPARKPAPVRVVHKAPPIVAPKKKKKVVRPVARRANPAPGVLRARGTSAAAPSRSSAQQQHPAPGTTSTVLQHESAVIAAANAAAQSTTFTGGAALAASGVSFGSPPPSSPGTRSVAA